MTTAPPPVLLLGGTGEARRIAAALDAAGVPVVSSLAGHAPPTRRPAGAVRVGGFGGADGLAAWLSAHGVRIVVDATHPFAARISASAQEACARLGVDLLTLDRPGFVERPGDDWHWVDDLDDAAAAIAGRGSRVLLTTGRQGLAAFAGVADAWFLVRCLHPPDPPLPPRHDVRLDRGPFTLEHELALLDAHRIDLLVTKDSGGDATSAKLDAARRRGVPAIVVRRPAAQDGSGRSVDAIVARVTRCATLTAPEPTSDRTAVSDDQDWRLQAELDVTGDDDALDAIVKDVDRLDGEGSLVTHDGVKLFAYASTQEGLATARSAIEQALTNAGASATIVTSHWDDRIGDWLQVDPPLDAAEQAATEATLQDAEQIETRTLVAKAGRFSGDSVEEAMRASAVELGLELTVVEHRHLLTSQLAFTVTGPRGRIDQFARGLQAEGLAMFRAEARVFEP